MKNFVKSVLRFYGGAVSGLLLSLFPRTEYETFFVPKAGHRQFLRIEKSWLGQTLKEEVFELADTPEKKEYLLELLKMEEITPEEYKKFLSPLPNKR